MWRNDCISEHIVLSNMIIRNITVMQFDRWGLVYGATYCLHLPDLVIMVLLGGAVFSFHVVCVCVSVYAYYLFLKSCQSFKLILIM
jgi:hypothetical protein